MHKDSANARRRRKVAIVIHDGLSPFEFGVACEVFGYDRSYLGVPWYDTSVVAPEPGPVMTQLGFTIEAPHGLEAVEAAHTVIVPPVDAGASGDRDEAARLDERLLEALRSAYSRGGRIASLCSGAFLLARAGLLDGRRATTHWTTAARLAEQFPSVRVDPKVLYIDEGRILTSAGSAASIDLCLHIVRKDFGAEIANTVARNLVVQPHRDGGQAQFVDMPLPPCDGADMLSATLEWAQEHLDENLSVQLLAERAVMSPRTFARRFHAATGTTPHRWLLRQRVHLAQRLLETTDYTVDHVADLCGLGTAANLRMHFDAVIGVAPSAYRRTFAQVVRAT